MHRWMDRLHQTRTRRSIGIWLLLAVAITGCGAQSAPAATSDNGEYWKLADPNQFGLDEEERYQIEQEIARYGNKINSVLIVRNGQLIYEQYFQQTQPDTPYKVYSVSKSILSALTGIAIRDGHLTGTDQRIAAFLPVHMEEREDSVLPSLTVEHLLTMSAGLHSIDPFISRWYSSRSWIDFVLNQPSHAEPGTQFDYNTGLTHLLSVVLTEATGVPTKELADDFLFGPMAITNYVWEQDPEGYYIGGTSLSMTPRDMAKFGYLYLNKGQWEGEQLIPEQWIQESLAPKTASSEYGYLFWLKEWEDSTNRKLQMYEANGYGGQHVRIVPALDAVIVVTCNPNVPPANADDLIEGTIVPALAEHSPEVIEPMRRFAQYTASQVNF